jgi:glutamine amidotransferase
MIVIIDYGMGNVGSIKNMIRKVGGTSTITADRVAIAAAEKLILPGVGAFDRAMANLADLGLIDLLRHKAQVDKVPLLGICLGMQLLADGSEEGQRAGLGLIPGRVVRFQQEDASFKIPHMGWNYVTATTDSPLFAGLDAEKRFYFVHSYHYRCDEARHVAGETTYGYPFTSVVQEGNIMGVQFHPEKSHTYGMQVFTNYVAL